MFTAVAFLLAATAFASRAAAQADVWRDSQEFEMRRAALERVSENRDRAPRERRQMASGTHLLDIKRLRAINVSVAQAAAPGGPLDLKFLAKSAAEINKRARRLQKALQFAKTKERRVNNLEAKPEALRSSLDILRSAITNFVDNPIFKNPRVADINLSINAAVDLEKVIELSGQVETACRRMSSSIP